MIGLALVTLVATLAAGIIKPFEEAVDRIFSADYAITAQNNFSPLPPQRRRRGRRRRRGSSRIASVRGGEAKAFDKTITITAVDPGRRQLLALRLAARLAGRRSASSAPTARSSIQDVRQRAITSSSGRRSPCRRRPGRRCI